MSFPLIQVDEKKIILLSGFRSEPDERIVVTARNELEAAAKRHGDAVAFGYVAGRWMPALGDTHHDSTSYARCQLRNYLLAIGRTSSVSPDLVQFQSCCQSFNSADRMAGLRILAGQMRRALGSGNVAVRTVSVSPWVLGAASPAAASPAQMTRRWSCAQPGRPAGVGPN